MTQTTVTEAVLTQVANEIHTTALSKGFWAAPHPFIAELNTKLMLIVSEVSEAMEVMRKEYADSPLNPYSLMTEMQGEDFVEEVVDVIIRALDLVFYFEGQHGNLADILTGKMAKNRQRPHMHGKRF